MTASAHVEPEGGAMRRVLAISSWVGVGHVGLSAIAPALQRIGVEALQTPTAMLSNHKAWPNVAGDVVPVATLGAMVDAMAANGWLAGLDAVLTGYLPTPEHVAFAVATAERVRDASPEATLVVDPVLGDAPKGLYLAEPAAAAIREALAPTAEVLTPNAFELDWLTGRPVDRLDRAVAAAEALAGARPGRRVLATSAPLGPSATGVIDASASAETRLFRAPMRPGVPHGVGDVFAGLIAGGLATGDAVGRLQALIDASLGAAHLALAAPDWPDAPAATGEPV